MTASDLTDDDWQRLDAEAIFAAGYAPIHGTQSLYFRDAVFAARAKLPAPEGDKGLSRHEAKPFTL